MENFSRRSLPAFSLIELAIALVIIGILMGAVLKGQELLESARLKSLMSQLNQYKLVTSSFVDRYGALPGDYDKASSYLKAGLRDGNNNGIIEGTGFDPGNGGFDHEAWSFWAHLAAAHLIPDPASPSQGMVSPLDALPNTKLGGKIILQHAPLPELSGHWFILGTPQGSSSQGGLLTPLQTLSLMKKMDTEDPFSGLVQVRNGGNALPHHQCLKSPHLLNTTHKHPTCIVYVQL